MIIFKEPIADREMRGHVIKMEEVPNQESCRVLCFIEPNCVSINFGPKREGKYRCELNNATEDSKTVAMLHKKMNYIYLGIEVKGLTVAFQCVKVARTSFLARGVDHHRASRVRNTNDRGVRFKTGKTKTNMAARGFFRPRSLLYCWRRNSHIKEALPAGTT